MYLRLHGAEVGQEGPDKPRAQ